MAGRDRVVPGLSAQTAVMGDQRSWRAEVLWGCEAAPASLPAAPMQLSGALQQHRGAVCRRWLLAWHLRPAGSSARLWKPADVFPNTAPTGNTTETREAAGQELLPRTFLPQVYQIVSFL